MATSKLVIKKKNGIVEKESPNSLKVKTTTKEVETKEPEKKVEEAEPVIDDKIKSSWNNYLTWLDKKGMKGKPELDKGDLGNKLFRQYIKENPDSGLSEKVIPSIRKAYIELRNDRIKEIQAGKAKTSVKVEDFMKHIIENEKSEKPDYVGQHLTQTMFPGGVVTKATGEVKKTSLLGKGGSKMMQ